MNSEDIEAFGLEVDHPVKVGNQTGSMEVLVRPFEIARGCAAMYYPEANILVPRALDGASKTPAFKAVPIVVEAIAGAV